LRVIFNIYERLKLAALNFVYSLGLPRPNIKLHPEEKACPWARGALQNWGFFFNIFATTEGSDFKIGRLVGFAKTHHKISPRRKKGVALGLGVPKYVGFPFNIYAMA